MRTNTRLQCLCVYLWSHQKHYPTSSYLSSQHTDICYKTLFPVCLCNNAKRSNVSVSHIWLLKKICEFSEHRAGLNSQGGVRVDVVVLWKYVSHLSLNSCFLTLNMKHVTGLLNQLLTLSILKTESKLCRNHPDVSGSCSFLSPQYLRLKSQQREFDEICWALNDIWSQLCQQTLQYSMYWKPLQQSTAWVNFQRNTKHFQLL